MPRFRPAVAVLILVQLFASLGHAQTVSTKPAVPLDPITAVIDAFRTHALVALSDAHAAQRDDVR